MIKYYKEIFAKYQIKLILYCSRIITYFDILFYIHSNKILNLNKRLYIK
jgi:hypothetical protein